MKVTLPEFPIAGGCVCGAVRYRITAAPLSVYRCHCKDCQRASGGSHTLSMPMRVEHVELLSGELASYDKPSDSGRVVRMLGCGNCRTTVWNQPLAAAGMLVLKAGTLDEAGWAVPVGNIWTSSALPYAVIAADEVNFDRQPPDRQPLYDAWSAAIA